MIPYTSEQISRIDRFIRAFDLGVIYFIAADAAGPVKIGRSTLLGGRLITLQIGNPNQLYVFSAFVFPKGRRHVVEQMLHGELEAHWLRGEWFSLSVEEARRACRSAIRRRVQPKVKAKPRKPPKGPRGTLGENETKPTSHAALKAVYKKHILNWSRQSSPQSSRDLSPYRSAS